MADFNINFKYSGMPKQAHAARQKAIQAQQVIDKQATTGVDKTGKSVDILKHMSKQLDQMIFVLKSISSGQGMGSTSSSSDNNFVPGTTNRRGRNFGRIISGAGALGIAGYAIHKINEIGNAYIERAGAQIGNVGLGGFRTFYGVYNSAEVGAGMKAYALGRGRFSNAVTRKSLQTGFDVGAVYGLSAEETLGAMGRFRRAGVDYSGTVNQAMGMGIQSDLPLLLKGMEEIFTTAMREGINTSEMGKTLGKDLAAMALRTPGGIDTALSITRKGMSVKQALARGEMGSLEGMYGAQAIRSRLMRRLTKEPEYIESLYQSGDITAQQKNALYRLNPNATYQDLLQKGGSSLANYLFKRTASEMSTTQFQIEQMRMVQKQYGTGARAKQRWTDMQSAGVSMSIGEIDLAWKQASGVETPDMRAKGQTILGRKAAEVKGGPTGAVIKQTQMREEMLFKWGGEFAKSSLAMEKSLLSIANTAAPLAVEGLKKLMNAAEGAAGVFNKIKREWNRMPSFQGSMKDLFNID